MNAKQRGWRGFGGILSAAVMLLFFTVVLQKACAIAQSLPSIEDPFYGYGANATGGGVVTYVDNLADSGVGSLRDALSSEGRIVRFSVAGDISLKSALRIPSDVTIDGFSAPLPGITIRDHRVNIQNQHNIIVQGLRFRGPANDTLRIWKGAYDIVVDHCSFSGSTDGALDITEGSHDITVSWNIFAKTGGSVPKPMLLKYGAYHISLFHNIFVENNIRNPEVAGHFPEYYGGPIDYQAPIADVRNNIIWNWDGVGTRVTSSANSPGWEATANIVNNLYSSTSHPQNAIIVYSAEPATIPAEAYLADNVSLTDVAKAKQYQTGLQLVNVNDPSNHAEFPTPDIGPGAQLSALEAAHQTYLGAGVRPLDAFDSAVLAQIDLPALETGDTTPPAIDIDAPVDIVPPADIGFYETEARSITISGTAWDNEATTKVECVMGGQQILPVTGTDAWQAANVALKLGNNDITCTAYDSAGNSDSESLVITVVESAPIGEEGTVEVAVASKTDDASEKLRKGKVLLNKGALLVGKAGIITAFRFQLWVPANAVVTEARLIFNCIKKCTPPISLRYTAAAADDAQAFSTERYDISARSRTASSVRDNPAGWQRNQENFSADLAAIVQEVVSRPGWRAGNHVVLFVEQNESGKARIITAFEKFPDAATKLLVRYGPPVAQ